MSILNLEVVYDQMITAVRGVSLDVPEGGIAAVLGTNGSGKTSLLRAVAGILPSQKGEVTHGQVLLDGERIDQLPAHLIRRRGLAMIPEGGGLFLDQSVEENLRMGSLRFSSQTMRGAVGRVWEWFPTLKERRSLRAGYLSGGQQQMLALARTLLDPPKILVMDEPSLGLAPATLAEIYGAIKRLNKEEGLSVLLVEQDAAQALAVSSVALILENGRPVLAGTSKELAEDPEVMLTYLGISGGEGTRDYRSTKHYRRRKRWLS